MHGHRGLVVVGGGEHLRRVGRDGGVLLDQRRHHATHGFDTQGQRGHVQQQHVLDVAGQYRALDGGADGHGLVRVDVLAGVLTEEFGHLLLHHGHAGLTAHQDHVGDVGGFHTGILDRGLARLQGAGHQLLDQGFQLGPGQLHHQVLGTALVSGDVRQVDLGLLGGGQLDLGFLGRFLQALHGQGVAAQVDAGVLLELVGQVINDRQVEVLATQEGVAVGGQHFELVLTVHFGDFDDGDIEGTATQVVDRDGAITAFLVQAIGQGRGGGLVDDALDLETGDAAGVLGGLALGIVEVSRHGDHRLGDFFTEIVFRGLLHFLEDLRGDLRRRHLLAFHFHPGVAVVGLGDRVGHHFDVLLDHFVLETTADQTLHRVQGVGRVGDRLTLGRLADEDFVVLGVGDDGRRRARALGVLDNLGFVPFHNSDTAVGGTQVNTDNLTHNDSFSFTRSGPRMTARTAETV